MSYALLEYISIVLCIHYFKVIAKLIRNFEHFLIKEMNEWMNGAGVSGFQSHV